MNERRPLEDGGVERIAIISANCRFPGSNSVEEFWNTMQQGKEGRNPNFTTRENEKGYEDLKDKVNFLKCPVDEFDAEFFNISANKAVLLDPQQRLLMELTWEALEKACINPFSLRGSATGVFVGASSIDYEKVIANSSLRGRREFHVGYISSSYGALSSHIAYFLGLNAKHATIDRGPASSLFTLEKACKSLERGESNLAIAAAINLILFPRLGEMENNLLENSFEKFSEGCGVVILKRLSDAVADGDLILGVIRSIGICTNAADGKFGEISQNSVVKAAEKAHLIAGLDPSDIYYIELQGQENIEQGAMKSVYGNNVSSGCVSDAIGNAESVAGFASLIKMISHFKYDGSMFPKNSDKSTSEKRYVAINSYGCANECAHLILEGHPHFPKFQVQVSQVNSQENDNKHYILTLSANSVNALDQLLESYKILLENTENDNLADICFTANNCRAQLSHRIAVLGNNKEDLLLQIKNRKFLKGSSGKSKIAFLFNSHNSFRFNLLSRKLYESNLQFKGALDQCSEIFQQKRNSKVCLMDLLWGEDINTEDKQKYLLPVNFSIQYSLTELLKSYGISPDAVLGYSTGEFSAAVASGLIPLSETLKFLMEISEEINVQQKLSLISVASSKVITEKLLSFYFEENSQVDQSELKIFGINSSDQVILGSNSKVISTAFLKLCMEESVDVKIIGDSINTFNFSKISAKLLETLQGQIANSSTLHCSYVSGSDSEFSTGIVDFPKGFKKLWSQGCRIFVDIGPGTDLLRLAKLNISQTQAATCVWGSTLSSYEDNLCSLATLLSKLFVVGSNINWKTWDENSFPSKVQIPTYPFQRERFWPIDK